MASAAGQPLALLGPIAIAGFAEVVDSVEIHTELLSNGRVEISRHRQIEDEQRPLLPTAGDLLAIIVEADDGAVGPGGAHHHVGLRQFVGERRPGGGHAVPMFGEF